MEPTAAVHQSFLAVFATHLRWVAVPPSGMEPAAQTDVGAPPSTRSVAPPPKLQSFHGPSGGPAHLPLTLGPSSLHQREVLRRRAGLLLLGLRKAMLRRSCRSRLSRCGRHSRRSRLALQ